MTNMTNSFADRESAPALRVRLALFLLLTLAPGSVAIAQTSDLREAYDSAVAASHYRQALAINQQLTASTPFGSSEWQLLALDRIDFLSGLHRWQEALAVVDTVVEIATEDSVRRLAADQAFHALNRAGFYATALEYAEEQLARATSCGDSVRWQADLALATRRVGLWREALTHISRALDDPCRDSLGGHLFVVALAAGEAHLALEQRDSAMHFAKMAMDATESEALGPRAILDAASLIAEIAGCDDGLEQWSDIRNGLHPKLEESADSIALYDLRSLDVLILMQLRECSGGRKVTSDSLIARLEKVVELGRALGRYPEQLLSTSLLRYDILLKAGSREAAIGVLAEAVQAALEPGSGISPEGQVALLYRLSTEEIIAGYWLAAIEHSQRALTIANTTGNTVVRVLALDGHGQALLISGYTSDAYKYLEEAEHVVLKLGLDSFVSSLSEIKSPLFGQWWSSPVQLWSDINESLAQILAMSGDYKAAETRFQRAYAFSTAVGDTATASRILIGLADTRMMQGDSIGAQRFRAEAESIGPGRPDGYDHIGLYAAAWAIMPELTADDTLRSKSAWAASDSLLAQGLAEQAPDLAAQLHNQRALALVLRYGRTGEERLREDAVRELRQSVSLLEDGHATQSLYMAYFRLGKAFEPSAVLKGQDVVSSEGDIAQAARYHRLAVQTAEDLGHPELKVHSLGQLALVEWYRRDISAADSAFMGAIKAAEEARFLLVREDRVRSAFLANDAIRYLYGNAVRFYASEHTERPWDALVIAELAKARGLSDLILQRAVSLEGYIDPLSGAIGSLREVTGDLAEQSEALEIQRREIEARLRQAAQVDSALREMFKASLVATLSDDALAELAARPEVAVLSFFVDKDRRIIYAWLIDEGHAWVYVTVGLDVIAQRLHELVGRTQAINRNRYGRNHWRSLRQQDSASRDLYSLLVGGLDTLIARSTAKTLVVVPHGWLNTVPFASLSMGDKKLSERFSVVVLPALHLLGFRRDAPGAKRSGSSFLGVVDPSNSLPRADLEVRNASRYFERAEILSDTAATEDAIYRAWHAATVIHFATHAVAVDTAPNAGYITVAAGPASDGRLTVDEVLSTPELVAELVVLSACESGGGKVLEGEGIMGFGRAFLAAGAEAVLVTLWPIDDQVAEYFMSEFYEYWRGRGMPIGEAFGLAQSATRSRHPDIRDWAAFELIAKVW